MIHWFRSSAHRLRPFPLPSRARIVSFTTSAIAVSCLGPFAVSAGPFLDPGHAASAMIAWATQVDVIIRGPIDIAMPGLGLASFGAGSNALGIATANSADVVSLGDGGSAALYFDSGIGNGPGDDLAIYENGFADLNGLFAELAFVEVSSDGIDYARFDTDALNPFPVASFDTLDPTDYHGLAGRHPAGIGTGFDLADLASDPLVQNGIVDITDVRYVRVVDVIGDGSTVDTAGNPIYDPYATAFASGGFDLEAIGVIHVPEPSRGSGLFIGLLGLGLARRRSGGDRTLRRSPRLLGSVASGMALLVFAGTATALTATFDDLGLGAESFENGAGLSGGFASGGLFFENNYSPDFGGFFDGYAPSTTTDNTTPGFGNQFSNITGSGAAGSQAFSIAFLKGSIVLPSPSVVAGAEFTNTTYAALSMLNGDAFAKKFGGASGNDADFFRLWIEGVDVLGTSTGTVELMLADYRFADNSLDFILDQWVFLDLTGLGVVSQLRFSFESSDVGVFGINTPQYFAIDNLVTIPEPDTALLLGIGMAWLSRRSSRVDDPNQ